MPRVLAIVAVHVVGRLCLCTVAWPLSVCGRKRLRWQTLAQLWPYSGPWTDWEGGYFPLTIQFSEDYPRRPPKCKFPRGFFHPNVYPSGSACLSILNEESGWEPSITVKKILEVIQDFLDQPNPADPAQPDGGQLFIQERTEYRRRVRQQAKQFPLPV
ncbi:SUMO-conjugating enzyme SCE1-like [Corylus avellana]|uniref:SUMO-conjugating enzyme SCE1-like n=1 Tax=Corylus avellana TaxID=13451 RepID=UPI00286A37DA|nr:SUMO-conjugating enzyme SCE1-like [Corylus avellana]